VLIAVYIPIGFQGGLTGALFSEFAFTLAGAVAVSAVIALTLSPMLCSRFMKPTQSEAGASARSIDHNLERITSIYRRILSSSG
jgi:multidrug efflux pump